MYPHRCVTHTAYAVCHRRHVRAFGDTLRVVFIRMWMDADQYLELIPFMLFLCPLCCFLLSPVCPYCRTTSEVEYLRVPIFRAMNKEPSSSILNSDRNSSLRVNTFHAVYFMVLFKVITRLRYVPVLMPRGGCRCQEPGKRSNFAPNLSLAVLVMPGGIFWLDYTPQVVRAKRVL